METYLKLKKSNCQNCYKCIRSCPVKSIKFSDNQAHIVSDECILCGQCFVVCPQNAKEIKNDTERVKGIIAGAEMVIASVAPSFIANFPNTGIENFKEALKKLGFYDVQETAIGATIVKKEYEKLIKNNKSSVLISSCCPSVNMLIQKYYPQALPYLAPVITPMQAHAKLIKEQHPKAKVVFIGPCISKKYEADNTEGYTDCVLTFEELAHWLEEKGVVIKEGIVPNENSRARFFPTTGGIINTMDLEENGYSYIAFDGVGNCINAINDIIEGKIESCFVEMSACKGACIGGPVMAKKQYSPVKDNLAIKHFAGKNDFETDLVDVSKGFSYIGINKTMPGNSEIKSVLEKMGKLKEEDELNCGACGYNTCREKAIAVIAGKADLSMCLPFLKGKAESFSDIITKNSPNGIIVLNEALEVQQINPAARKILNIKNAADVLGEQVVRILDPKPFLDVMETGMAMRGERAYLAEYRRYVEQSIVYDRSYRTILSIMRDVTDEENEKNKKEQMSMHTIEVTDRVIEKQMRVVQEIASLLGETTAETKIALTKLKDSLADE